MSVERFECEVEEATQNEKARLVELKEQLLKESNFFNESNDEMEGSHEKVLIRETEQTEALWKQGLSAIDSNIEAYKDNLYDQGITDEREIARLVMIKKGQEIRELAEQLK